jgi:excisionase family DNA binding protein
MSQDIENEDALRVMLTVPEAARRLSIGKSMLYKLMRSGEVGFVNIGSLRRVPADCLVEFVERCRREQDVTRNR